MEYDISPDGGGPNHFLSLLRIVVGKEIGRNARMRGEYDTAVEGYEMALEEVENYRGDITELLEGVDRGSDVSDALVEFDEVLNYWERSLDRELAELQFGMDQE